MATITKTATLRASAPDVWSVVSDIGNVPALTGMITESVIKGDHRTCRMADGQTLEESILSVDHDLQRLAYRVHSSPFPMTEHAASIVVTDDNGAAHVTWTTDLLPDSAAPIFAEAADLMFADMIERMGGTA
ncbi:SRPBCC family protein [uncultured Tateyamaria sp.]|uniref:SRPBCC family protein n=1 Tax=uncultured Tateyamaria sp. TaxID=455651 RepID=UPI002637FE5E|nr:SRPBCC family protein [uncultured Tateyamaria sp.]